MTYVPPKYPVAIPTIEDLPNRQDDVHWIKAERYNELKKELRAALIELGVLPKGSSASVVERIKGIRSLADAVADAIIVKLGNVGVGVIPEADWETGDAGYRVLQIGHDGALSGRIGTPPAVAPLIILSENKVHTDLGDELIRDGYAVQLVMASGIFYFQVGPEGGGIAGEVIVWREVMRLQFSGTWINLDALPIIDPHSAGRLWRDGTDLKISLG